MTTTADRTAPSALSALAPADLSAAAEELRERAGAVRADSHLYRAEGARIKHASALDRVAAVLRDAALEAPEPGDYVFLPEWGAGRLLRYAPEGAYVLPDTPTANALEAEWPTRVEADARPENGVELPGRWYRDGVRVPRSLLPGLRLAVRAADAPALPEDWDAEYAHRDSVENGETGAESVFAVAGWAVLSAPDAPAPRVALLAEGDGMEPDPLPEYWEAESVRVEPSGKMVPGGNARTVRGYRVSGAEPSSADLEAHSLSADGDVEYPCGGTYTAHWETAAGGTCRRCGAALRGEPGAVLYADGTPASPGEEGAALRVFLRRDEDAPRRAGSVQEAAPDGGLYVRWDATPEDPEPEARGPYRPSALVAVDPEDFAAL